MRWQRSSGLPARALRSEAGQGPYEADGNPAHLLPHPHGKRGATGGQDRTESTAGGLLKRNMHIETCFHRGSMPLSLRMEKNPAEPTGMRNKNVNLMD